MLSDVVGVVVELEVTVVVEDVEGVEVTVVVVVALVLGLEVPEVVLEVVEVVVAELVLLVDGELVVTAASPVSELALFKRWPQANTNPSAAKFLDSDHFSLKKSRSLNTFLFQLMSLH